MCAGLARKYRHALDGHDWRNQLESAQAEAALGNFFAVIGVIIWLGGLWLKWARDAPWDPQLLSLGALGTVVLALSVYVHISTRTLRAKLLRMSPRRSDRDRAIVNDHFLELNWRLYLAYQHLSALRQNHPALAHELEDIAHDIDSKLLRIRQEEHRRRARSLVARQRGIEDELAQLSARITSATT